MSVLGSNIVASVAQTTVQAQQVARQRDRHDSSQTEQNLKVREMFEAHLKALEEDNHETPAHLHVDGQLPEHQSAGQEQSERRQHNQHPPTPTDQVTLNATPPDQTPVPAAPLPPNDDQPLYRHLDIRG